MLAEIADLIGSTSDLHHLLPRLAHLAIPALGDLCAIDLLQDSGTLDRVAGAHVDPTKETLVNDAWAQHGFNPSSPHGVTASLRAREPLVVRRMTRSHLAEEARDAAQLSLLRELGPKSWMVVPLVGREQLLGAMTFAITESARRYTQADLRLAEVVARQTGTAIEGARFLEEAETARRAAEAENRAKDEFLSRLSHELRNPLNAVLGWARILERGRLDEEQTHRAIQIILRNTAAQIRLLDDLNDVSGVVRGNVPLRLEPLDLAQVVQAALDGIAPAMDAKGLRLRAALELLGTTVNGDPGRLQQVVGNLLDNAVKFTPNGGDICVVVRRVDSVAEVVVTDTGSGIPRDVLPYVFDHPGHGAEAAATPHGGRGVGLPLVQRLVELHGGSVFAESAGEGRGATFTVRLPLMTATASARLVAPQSVSPAVEESLGGVRVLVVDDDPAAVALVTEVLARAGGDVRGCQDVDEALEMMVGAWCPDVLVSDIEMPGQDGYTFIRKVRALAPERGGSTPAVALTGLNRTVDRIRSLDAGFNIHVAKPVDPGELTAVVASLARRAG